MAYRIAGVDVHKKMLAVAMADVEVEGEWRFGTSPTQLRAVAKWFSERDVEEVVMESTAQYWRPVWDALEREWQPVRQARAEAGPTSGALHLAQAQSNKGPRGRKRDFPDAERLVRRLVAHELTLSFVPDVTQRLWRTVTRRKYQVTRNRVQLQNRLECLLEEMHIKLSSLVADLLGPSAGCCARWRMAQRIRPPWPPSGVSGCARRQISCGMRSEPPPSCIRFTVACSQ